MSSARRFLLMMAFVVVALILVIFTRGWSSTGSPRTDRLGLHGRAPTQVEFSLSLATSGSLRTSGTVWLDMRSRALRATLLIPVVSANTEIDVRALGHHVYLTSPNLADASGPVWYVQHFDLPKLTGLPNVLLRPDTTLLTLLANARISRHGEYTTYEMKRFNVSFARLNSSSKNSTLPGNLDLRLTTGKGGEVTGLQAHFTSGASTTSISLQVLSYDPQLSIVAPPASRATTPAGPLLRQLFASGVLGSLVVPTQLLQLIVHAKLA